MSAHTKMHHTNSPNRHTSVLYITHNHKTYAIPRKIANKYIIDEKTIHDSVSVKVVFAKLEAKLTKAGALLKGLRTREGLSQSKFAKKIEVTQANLSKMENGYRPIGKTVAKRIEKIFGTDYRYFLE